MGTTSQPILLFSCSSAQTNFQYLKPITTASQQRESQISDEALRNQLILKRIFESLPTALLLSSCSLVNKYWNREVRKFIRDFGNCTVKKSKETHLCQFLQQLSLLCNQVKRAGRVVPYNSVELHLAPSLSSCSPCTEKFSIEKFVDSTSELKLKHLKIYASFLQNENVSCDVHEPLLHLLCHKGPGLQVLEIKKFPPDLRQAFSSGIHWVPNFPTLKQLKISYTSSSPASQNEEKAILRRILDGAPKLQGIFVDSKSVLNMFTESKFGLLKTLDYRFDRIDDEAMFRRVLDGKPQLEAICITQTTGAVQEYLQQQWFHSVLEQLLTTCSRSLRTINVRAAQPFPQLANIFPTMVNLTSFRLTLSCTQFKHLCDVLVSIAPCYRNMPRLGELSVTMTRPGPEYLFTALFKVTTELLPVGPSQDSLRECSSNHNNIRKLRLDLNYGNKLNFALLKNSFPCVSYLDLNLKGTSFENGTFRPFSDIPKLWPNLVVLRISCDGSYVKEDLDAEFCGIHEEEVEFMRQQEEQYLTNVQVVPVRPCLATMPDLKKLWLNLKLMHPKGAQKNFLSKVTPLVVLNRMIHTDVSVSLQLKKLV